MINIKTETRLKGIKLSVGIAVARVCLFNDDRHSNLPVYQVKDAGKEAEKQRIRKAIKLSVAKVENIIKDVEARVGLSESKIFVAQKMLLEDSTVHNEFFDDIDRNGYNAEAAVTRILDRYESKLLEVDNEYIKARATDIGEIKRRLLDVLTEINPSFQCVGTENCQRGKNKIVVAKELTPGLTVSIDTAFTKGFITEHGGKLSHAAILARSLGIPAVSGIKNIHSLVTCGTEILVNGHSGEIIINPTDHTVSEFKSRYRDLKQDFTLVSPVKGITVMANINKAQDTDEALSMKAEGIGLYRTEFEFLVRGHLLSEDEQFLCYSQVLKTMEGLPVYFRLLDIGGDKGADFFDLPEEENPYLGFRGSRLLAKRTDLFRTQARALAKASLQGEVSVMYPMIIDLEQFLNLRVAFEQEIANITHGKINHGVMFEVPSACLQAREILEHADFASIGTNDLIQYLFAVDRNNEHVAYDFTPERKVFWNVLKIVADAAKETRKPLSICGETASNPEYLKRIIDIGIKQLSVSPRHISAVRNRYKELKKK